ncbi:hypothetical protein AMD26_015085, partial [Deinococcus sp. UR1]
REALSALMDKAPVVTAAAPVQISTTTAGATTTDAGTVTVTPPATQDAERPQDDGAKGQDEGPKDEKPKDENLNDQTDMSDPASVAQLPRTELFGLARSFGIEVAQNISTVKLAEKIAAAFRETPEYKDAQATAKTE